MDAELVTEGGARIGLRPATAADEPLLYELYCDRRRAELATLGWTDDAMRGFLDLQFRAQQQGYGAEFPGAEHRIVVEGGVPVGRLLVDRGLQEHRVVDVVLLSTYRGRGLGTALMKAVLADASAAGVRVRLTASRTDDGLVGWYESLGFSVVGQDDALVSMVGGG